MALNDFILRRLVPCIVGFWVFASTYPYALFGFMNKWIFRLKGEYISPEADSNSSMKSNSLENVPREVDSLSGPDGIDSELGTEENVALGLEDSKPRVVNDEEEPESSLRFRFQRYEEFMGRGQINDGACISSKPEQVDDDTEMHDEHMDDKPETVSLTGSSSNEDFYDPSSHAQFIADGDGSLSDDEELRIPSKAASLQPDEQINEGKYLRDEPFAYEDGFEVSSESDSESVVSSSNFSVRSSLVDSINGGYLSDDDDSKIKIDLSMLKGFETGNTGSHGTLSSLEEAEFQDLSKPYGNDDSEEDEDLLAELKGIEEDVSKTSQADKDMKGKEERNHETNSEEENTSDWEESNGMETQWEHQDLIEQLRMEIGKVRATGLPTIFEDSETPKMADDLKLWKIDEKLFQVGGTMDEVHKFYKSYRERMRKFDIFNYQKMYAIGFLRLKDPLQSFSAQKISLATIVSQDCWPCKPKSSATNNYSMMKFTRELESDLEMVYVGQLCLSWEFLHWEYGKALALWDSDPHEIRRYNEVAGEFQQFQVLLQRFLDDEPFQGASRVQTYVKNRCIHRRLLQVPVIREDSMKDRMKQRTAGSSSEDGVTSVVLIEMIEESIRLLWQFIRTDKDTMMNRILTCRKASRVEPQNPEDAALLIEVQESLRKKQKKVKELMRSDCCILRKLQRNKPEQNYAGRVLSFFSQVDFKLVARVLNMTRVTSDQLAWCNSKLQNIEFVDNRIRRDPSFLLFPCS